ncbi:MAG: class I SAM-dependent methyltransferase [Planctomycetaceae bacterium]|jgi:hypothetical protein|nr:class I SAM-dependent methyltransferase [Planctomycetaceae bacterium]
MKSYATKQDQQYKEEMEAHLRTIANQAPLTSIANGFAKYARRQEVTRFLARYEMFKMVQDIQGVIVECGVYAGQGLLSWAQMSAILEPVGGAFRHIYGFDTFEGFPGVHAKDLKGSTELGWKAGDLKCDSYADLSRCIELFDKNRFLPQMSKISLIKGDFMQTAETFLEKNPHVLVSLLYLDFDLYEPTKKGLEVFLPRMSKGAVLAFDEINHPLWPGETLALLESMNIRDVKIQKFPFEINMSYIVL